MKSFVSALLLSGLAVAAPHAKRDLVTDTIVNTVWTTTTLYSGPTHGAQRYRSHSAAPSAPAALPTSSAAPAVPTSIPAQSSIPSSSVAAPSVAVPSPSSVAVPSAAPSAVPAAAPVSSGGGLASGTGQATWYDVSVGAGSCGLPIAGPNDAVVAIAHADMANGANSNNNPLCGKTITINYNGASHSGKVYDTCGDCPKGNIDLSAGFFKTVFPNGDGRVSGVSWTVG